MPQTKQVGGDHYRNKKIEPFEYIRANDLDFFEGNIIKYVTRHKDKNGKEDLLKAKQYIDEIIENEYTKEKPEKNQPDEIHLLKDLVNQIPKGKYTSIVSTGRGAGWLAANLAYALGIKEIRILSAHEIYQLNSDETLFVDSIVDTGRTLQSIIIDSAALVVNQNTTCWPTYHARIVNSEAYVTFPIGQMFDNQKEK